LVGCLSCPMGNWVRYESVGQRRIKHRVTGGTKNSEERSARRTNGPLMPLSASVPAHVRAY
jgi:hypothetical protein